jgi:hypothetical protein
MATLSRLLLLSGIGLAQISPAVVATPGVSPATPEAGPSVSVAAPIPSIGRPPQVVAHWRSIHIVGLIIRVVLALSASFAFISLGTF